VERLIYINSTVDIFLFSLRTFLSFPPVNFLSVEEYKENIKELIFTTSIINFFCILLNKIPITQFPYIKKIILNCVLINIRLFIIFLFELRWAGHFSEL
jgi:hypothetical protein